MEETDIRECVGENKEVVIGARIEEWIAKQATLRKKGLKWLHEHRAELTCRRDCACCGLQYGHEVCAARWRNVLMPPRAMCGGSLRIDMDPRKCIYMLPRALGF